jgi:hypothetical protein
VRVFTRAHKALRLLEKLFGQSPVGLKLMSLERFRADARTKQAFKQELGSAAVPSPTTVHGLRRMLAEWRVEVRSGHVESAARAATLAAGACAEVEKNKAAVQRLELQVDDLREQVGELRAGQQQQEVATTLPLRERREVPSPQRPPGRCSLVMKLPEASVTRRADADDECFMELCDASVAHGATEQPNATVSRRAGADDVPRAELLDAAVTRRTGADNAPRTGLPDASVTRRTGADDAPRPVNSDLCVEMAVSTTEINGVNEAFALSAVNKRTTLPVVEVASGRARVDVRAVGVKGEGAAAWGELTAVAVDKYLSKGAGAGRARGAGGDSVGAGGAEREDAQGALSSGAEEMEVDVVEERASESAEGTAVDGVLTEDDESGMASAGELEEVPGLATASVAAEDGVGQSVQAAGEPAVAREEARAVPARGESRAVLARALAAEEAEAEAAAIAAATAAADAPVAVGGVAARKVAVWSCVLCSYANSELHRVCWSCGALRGDDVSEGRVC